MLILGVDTSSPRTSLAILDGDRPRTVFDQTHDQPPSDAVFSILERLMREAGLRPADFDAYAACIGPGSFTGLRIGLGLAKAFAFTHRKPVYGPDAVHLLALALSRSLGAATPDRFAAVVPGWRETSFASIFRMEANEPRREGEMIWKDGWSELLAWLPGDLPVFLPTHAEAPIPGARRQPPGECPALAAARFAAQEHATGRRPDFHAAQPLYLKPFAVGKKAARPEDLRR